MDLRPYQKKLEQEIYEAWQSGAVNVLAQLHTGGGKTVIFSKIVSDFPHPAIVIAHRVEIVSQISLALAKYQVRHNIIAQKSAIREIVRMHLMECGQSYYDSSSIKAVAGVDTLLRMDSKTSWFSKIRLVVQDEAHHVLAKNKWGIAAALFPQAYGLYPTATPIRTDGCGLGRHADGIIDVMVQGPSMRYLIETGYLSDYRIIAPPNNLDLSEVPLSAGGDYSPKKLRQTVHKSKITGDVVAHYLKFAPGKSGVTFAVDIEAASEIASEFRVRGVSAEVISSKTPSDLRSSIMRKFRNREILQLVNVDILGEGVDVPAIEVVSMARPTQSYGLFCQSFGRALRPMPGKKISLIIDHVDNVRRHGLPDNLFRTWSLGRRDKRSKNKALDITPVKTCLNIECFAVYEKFLKSCPICGHYSPPSNRSAPEFVDGDLLELDEDTLLKLRGQIDLIDGAPRIPSNVSPIIQRAISNTHKLRQQNQRALRSSIASWAGYLKADGKPDGEIYRRFFINFGLDIATAQTLGSKDAIKLKATIDDLINSE